MLVTALGVSQMIALACQFCGPSPLECTLLHSSTAASFKYTSLTVSEETATDDGGANLYTVQKRFSDHERISEDVGKRTIFKLVMFAPTTLCYAKLNYKLDTKQYGTLRLYAPCRYFLLRISGVMSAWIVLSLYFGS